MLAGSMGPCLKSTQPREEPESRFDDSLIVSSNQQTRSDLGDDSSGGFKVQYIENVSPYYLRITRAHATSHTLALQSEEGVPYEGS